MPQPRKSPTLPPAAVLPKSSCNLPSCCCRCCGPSGADSRKSLTRRKHCCCCCCSGAVVAGCPAASSRCGGGCGCGGAVCPTPGPRYAHSRAPARLPDSRSAHSRAARSRLSQSPRGPASSSRRCQSEVWRAGSASACAAAAVAVSACTACSRLGRASPIRLPLPLCRPIRTGRVLLGSPADWQRPPVAPRRRKRRNPSAMAVHPWRQPPAAPRRRKWRGPPR